MDNPEFTSGADKKQIDRRRGSVIRDFKDALDPARNDLAFEMGRAINLAINLSTKVLANGEPSSHDVFLVEESVRLANQEHEWASKQAWCAFERAFADEGGSP
jgi:hypothetical protein